MDFLRKIAPALFAAICLSPASAMEFDTVTTDGGRKILIAMGSFEFDDDLSDFRRALNRYRPDIVTFNSEGGNPITAMKYGREIRARGLDTFQTRAAECASACALAFLGGVNRIATPSSIGVHQTSFASESTFTGDEKVQLVQDLTARQIAYLSEMGVSAELMQIVLAVEPDDIRYLTGREMSDLRVTHFPGDSQTQTALAEPSKPEIDPSIERAKREITRKMETGTVLAPENPSPSNPAPAPKKSLSTSLGTAAKQAAAKEFVADYHQSWSSTEYQALSFVRNAYESTVVYYGKTVTGEKVVSEKGKFLKRWPLRVYFIDPNELNATCSSSLCDIEARVIWYAHSPQRNAHSSGEAIYHVKWNPSSRKIVAENGEVTARDNKSGWPTHLMAYWKRHAEHRRQVSNLLFSAGWCLDSKEVWKQCNNYVRPAVYSGPVRMPDFSGRDSWARMYRTRIRDGIRGKNPDFAFKYRIVTIGCGTSCSFAYMIDLSTGEVFGFPRGGEENSSMTIYRRPDTSKLAIEWYSFKRGSCILEQAVFERRQWSFLTRDETPGYCN